VAERIAFRLGVLWLAWVGAGCVQIGSNAPVLTDREGARPLAPPLGAESFSFVVLADATDAGPNNVDVLRRAVREANLLGPDLVLNVGDMVQGYCDRDRWLVQMKEVRQVMDGLAMPWFPTPGNHDVYWSTKLPSHRASMSPTMRSTSGRSGTRSSTRAAGSSYCTRTRGTPTQATSPSQIPRPRS